MNKEPAGLAKVSEQSQADVDVLAARDWVRATFLNDKFKDAVISGDLWYKTAVDAFCAGVEHERGYSMKIPPFGRGLSAEEILALNLPSETLISGCGGAVARLDRTEFVSGLKVYRLPYDHPYYAEGLTHD